MVSDSPGKGAASANDHHIRLGNGLCSIPNCRKRPSCDPRELRPSSSHIRSGVDGTAAHDAGVCAGGGASGCATVMVVSKFRTGSVGRIPSDHADGKVGQQGDSDLRRGGRRTRKQGPLKVVDTWNEPVEHQEGCPAREPDANGPQAEIQDSGVEALRSQSQQQLYERPYIRGCDETVVVDIRGAELRERHRR